MSQEEMSQEEAALFENMYAPAFVQKMAANGRPINDEETLEHAIELTARVKKAVQEEDTNSIKEANLDFRRATGADVEEAVEAIDTSTKEAARNLVADPGFKRLLAAARAAQQ